MTDRELLKMAAKAAGYWSHEFSCVADIPHGAWNPLQNDGDALLLALRLRISINHEDPDAAIAGWTRNQRVPFTLDGNGPWFTKEWYRDNTDASAATRRAICRAAAAIVQEP